MRVAVYLRISTDEEHQPYSLGAEDERLRVYINSQPGWTLVRTFEDRQSGATLERKDLQPRWPRHGRFDLLVYRVDRLLRSVPGLAERDRMTAELAAVESEMARAEEARAGYLAAFNGAP